MVVRSLEIVQILISEFSKIFEELVPSVLGYKLKITTLYIEN